MSNKSLEPSETGPILFRYRKEIDIYPCFSNFYPARLIYKSKPFRTNEHAYQASKTIIQEEINGIANAPTPYQAMKLGRKCTMRKGWKDMKIEVMDNIVICKFTQNEDLRQILLSTGERELVEWAPWDAFWGNGRDGKGLNWLGRLLMRTRDQYRVTAAIRSGEI